MAKALTLLPTEAARAVGILLAAMSRGVQVFLEDDRLRIRPPEGLIIEERAVLRSMREQGPMIAHELRWRLDTMRCQIPRSSTPIPALLARLNARRMPAPLNESVRS